MTQFAAGSGESIHTIAEGTYPENVTVDDQRVGLYVLQLLLTMKSHETVVLIAAYAAVLTSYPKASMSVFAESHGYALSQSGKPVGYW